MSILGNAVGCYSPIGKTFTIVDENNNEITGVVVDQEVVFTAGDNDVREGMIYASDSGVSTGTKNIPIYRTTSGLRAIPSGSTFSIPLDKYSNYDYTKLQCLIAPFNTSAYDSYAVDKVVIGDGVYSVGSADKIADVTKNFDTQSIDLNITNTSNDAYFIYYFTYREEI